MASLLVNLYDEKLNEGIDIKLDDNNIYIKRLLSPNSDLLVEFIKENKFDQRWISEVKAAIYKPNPTCFIAVSNKKIIGFACYDATAKGYFGPTGVSEKYRGKNIGQKLFINSLYAMRNDGYGYAVIGGAGKNIINFYSKYVNCMLLEEDFNIYSRLI